MTDYVHLRIEGLRLQNPGSYNNAAVLNLNVMKYLPMYIAKSSIDKIFVCFPDPHFKTCKFKRRMISQSMLTEFAYVLKPFGRLYFISDVESLHEWHMAKCLEHGCFRELLDVDDVDICVKLMKETTEEGIKVERNGGKKWNGVFERVSDEEVFSKGSVFA